MARRLTVLHTNDFHNHLTREQANTIRTRKLSVEGPVVLLDAGDAVSAGNVGVRLGGEPILDLMSETGYDAMTMGNREFHIADAVLRHKIGKATFPVLSANMRYKDGDGELPTRGSAIIETAHLRVGVVGLTVPMVTERMAARHLSSFLFDEAIDTARREVEELQSACDALILLSHVGYRTDQRLAAACPALALIVGGHSHAVLESADMEWGVPIVQAGWFGKYLGTVVLEESDGKFHVVSSGLEPLVGS